MSSPERKIGPVILRRVRTVPVVKTTARGPVAAMEHKRQQPRRRARLQAQEDAQRRPDWQHPRRATTASTELRGSPS
ncbi:unnamed protein product [Ixodes pacificus]